MDYRIYDERTPGLWIADPYGNEWILLNDAGADVLAGPFDAGEADAALIGAAPLLLERCKKLEAAIDAHYCPDPISQGPCGLCAELNK